MRTKETLAAFMIVAPLSIVTVFRAGKVTSRDLFPPLYHRTPNVRGKTVVSIFAVSAR